MSAISVAQACRASELAFMGFLFFLLRNVMGAISMTQACRVTELALHDFFKWEIILMQGVMIICQGNQNQHSISSFSRMQV